MSWTDERVKIVKALWQDGLSASQIAARLGGVTRNAVIGIIHRRGFGRRIAPTKPTHIVPKPPTALRAPKVAKTPHNPLGGKLANLTAPAPPSPSAAAPRPIRALAWSPLPGCLPVSIMDRKESQCSWPIDLAGAAFPHFCGAKRKGRGSYCAAHNTLAANPSAAKPDRTEAQLLADAKRRASHLKRIADLRDARWAS